MVNSSERSSADMASIATDASIRLADSQAQIVELIEINKRLRTELSEMTLMWVAAMGESRKPMHALRRAVVAMRESFGSLAPAPAKPIKRSVRDYQMLGALSALQQGRHTGLVIPTVELLALGYAMEVDGSIWISPSGEDVLHALRASLLNTGQHPVVVSD